MSTKSRPGLHRTKQHLAGRLCDDDFPRPGVQTEMLPVEMHRMFIRAGATVDANLDLQVERTSFF
jgi:hypothetical protein